MRGAGIGALYCAVAMFLVCEYPQVMKERFSYEWRYAAKATVALFALCSLPIVLWLTS